MYAQGNVYYQYNNPPPNVYIQQHMYPHPRATPKDNYLSNEYYYNKEIEETKDKLKIFKDQFDTRVNYDLKRYLFLGVKQCREISLSQVIKDASILSGYEKHKRILYHADDGDRICHLYIKYSTSVEALEAREIFRSQDLFHAEIVADILKSWYSYEKCCGNLVETTGVLDIVGETQYSQPLTKEIASTVVRKFGNPSVVQISENYFKVTFQSMAEGIAACISFGKWYVKSTLQDAKFYYRVLLNKSHQFNELIGKCNQTSKTADAYRLEYFIPQLEMPSELNYENARKGKEYLTAGSLRGGRQFYRGRGGYRPNYKSYKQRNNGFQNYANAGYYAPNMKSETGVPIQSGITDIQNIPGNLSNVNG